MRKRMSNSVVLGLVSFLISGCATIFTYQQETAPTEAPIEQHRSMIVQWESEFQASAYSKKMQMLKTKIASQVQSEKSVLESILMQWNQSIHSGSSFSYDIAQGLASAESGGWVEIYRMYFSSLKKAMSEISNPPTEYSKAYDLLLDVYSIYSQLYSLARSPQGSYVSFNKTVNDISLEFEKGFNKLDVLLPQ